MEEYITSRKNPLIAQVRRLLASRRERECTGLFVADGTKLLQEAVDHCPGLQTVILTEDVHCQLPPQVRRVYVPQDVMVSVSPMASPQGALFVCAMPQKRPFVPATPMLLLDGIQDPGNLGTILRTADAMQIPVALLEGCADPYSHKTVRASMGAVFRTDVVQVDWADARQALTRAGIPIAVTALSDRAEDIRSAALQEMAVIIGSEGQGIRPQILQQADHALIIPMSAHCESLNAAVAAAIVAWQMRCSKDRN